MKQDLTKINENLYYDERSAGGIVYRVEGNQVKWLLIKTITSNTRERGRGGRNGHARARYKFPKGHVQGNEFLKQAALREVEEEARVKAEVMAKIGSRDYVIWDKENRRKIIKKVTFFLMKYLGESNLRYFDKEVVIGREWMSYEEACGKLAYDSEKLLLTKAKERLERIGL